MTNRKKWRIPSRLKIILKTSVLCMALTVFWASSMSCVLLSEAGAAEVIKLPAVNQSQPGSNPVSAPQSGPAQTEKALQANLPDAAALREVYYDLAAQYRFDYLPFFSEGNAPSDSTEYLYYAFAVNLDHWGDEKGVMTREYVEQFIRSYFGVSEIKHASLPRAWNYDETKYTAVPTSIKENPIYVLSKLEISLRNGKTIYKATLGCYNYGDTLPDAEELQKIRQEVIAGDLSELTLMQNEEVEYYWDKSVNKPVFLAHTQVEKAAVIIGGADGPTTIFITPTPVQDPGTDDQSGKAEKTDPVYDPSAYLTDEEMATADSIRLGMTYDEVRTITGEPEEAFDNAPDVKSIIKNGYHYGFYQINDGFPEDYPLPHDGRFYLLNIVALENCTDPLVRGIRIGDSIDEVFAKFPVRDRVLKKWALQTVYGCQKIGQPRAFLEFTTVLGTYRLCATTTTQTLNIHFDKHNKVRNVDLLFEPE